jgi:[ribosomal protein S18]-alanine N-acetyltransferase
MTLLIRPMAESDITQVAAIEQAVQVAPWSLIALQACLPAGYTCLVLEQNREVIGFIIVQLVLDECHILNLGIAPNWQRQGMGQLLLRYVITLATKHHCRHCLLEVRRSNQVALRLYQRHSFQIIGTRRDYYRTPSGREDALLLELVF